MTLQPRIFFFSLLFAISNASAQGGDRVAAEVLFQKGRAAMDRGEYESACASFRESHRLDAAVGTMMNLAACEEKQGLLASSWEHWQHALKALSPNDRRLPYVEERIAELEADLPRLTIVVQAPIPERIELERDGKLLGRVAWGVAIPVDPGVHEVIVRSLGHLPRTYRIEVSKGEAKTLRVTTGPQIRESAPDQNRVDSRYTWAYVTGGLGIVGLGTAVATGVMLQNVKDTVNENCSDRQCNPRGMQAVRRGKTLLAVNTAGFIVAGVGLGTGATLLLWPSGSRDKSERQASRDGRSGSHASLRVLRTGVALTYRRTF